jgi:hypothetical protein
MSKRHALILAVVGVVTVVISVTASGAGRFTDVPSSNPFMDSIEWLADAGVSKGCNPPANTKFCPKDNVTREQMAAFLRRFYDNVVPDPVGLAAVYQLEGSPGPSGNGIMLETVVTVPSAGLLVAEATAEFSNFDEAATLACGLNFGYATNLAEPDSWRYVSLLAEPRNTCATQTSVSVGPGTYRVRLVSSGTLPTTIIANGSLHLFFYSDFAAYPLAGQKGAPIPAPQYESRSSS